jgi:YidC/Oxa1 family membrane protein insertase
MKWAAMQDKYFLAAAIPADAVTHIGVVRKEGERLVSVGLRTPASPGTVASRYRLFVGPKEYDTLAALKIELEETIDFGWFIYGSWSFVRAVAKPLFYAIRYLHDLTHNYGVAIIIVTLGIKLLLAPLAYKSYKSMKDMAAVQPELMALQKKYADDRERLNKELIKLYKDKKVNPVGGCLPMFFQIPIFVALFNILYMTIELRQAPFLLWVKDLSVQDPYYVLPILMGVTMFIQQKIQPTTMDPKQAQIMLLLPVFLTFLFVTFPAGLVLYWLTNNVLTITQQVVTDRYILPKAPVPATAPAAK